MNLAFGLTTHLLVGLIFANATILAILLSGIWGRPQCSSTVAPSADISIWASNNRLGQIANATLGFGSIFAINLPERTDNRDVTALAAAVSNISVAWIPGVKGETVLDKTLPGAGDLWLPPGYKGCWRAHMNTLRTVVESGIGTALILEDDADWDINLRQQLYDLAVSVRSCLKARSTSAGETPFKPAIPFNGTHDPTTSVEFNSAPYGTDWDLLWLGHFKMGLTANEPHVVHSNDTTVPDPSLLKDEYMASMFPPHTRIVQLPSNGGIGSTAYAVSQRGARKLLYFTGVARLDGPFDVMLNQFCRRQDITCGAVIPPLFEQHKRRGRIAAHSDISQAKVDGLNEKAYTEQIVTSVKVNLAELIDGQSFIG